MGNKVCGECKDVPLKGLGDSTGSGIAESEINFRGVSGAENGGSVVEGGEVGPGLHALGGDDVL